MNGPRSAPLTDKHRVLAAEQAAEWLVRMQDPAVTATERSDFAAWLKFSPAHVSEFLNARATWEAMNMGSLQHLPDSDALLQELAETLSADVLPIGQPATSATKNKTEAPGARRTHAQHGIASASKLSLPPTQRSTSANRNRTRRRLLAVAAAVSVIGIAGIVQPTLVGSPNHATYKTAVGKQATHVLKDGSTLTLNTHSRVRLNWSEQSRDIYLEQGEALFDVAHDPNRPFRVWIGDAMVRALGTQFNIYRTHQAVTVTVLEGKVLISNTGKQPDKQANAHRKPNSGESAIAIAGERVVLHRNSPIAAEKLENPEKAVVWREHRLEFDGTPLSQVIGEFNRYSTKPLMLQEADLATKRISGSFDATDRASLVAFLEEFEDIRVEVQKDAVRLRKK